MEGNLSIKGFHYDKEEKDHRIFLQIFHIWIAQDCCNDLLL